MPRRRISPEEQAARDVGKFMPETAEAMAVAALDILQRELPGGGLTARQAIAELWAVFDTPQAQAIIKAEQARQRRA
jgi:hypothetical protein